MCLTVKSVIGLSKDGAFQNINPNHHFLTPPKCPLSVSIRNIATLIANIPGSGIFQQLCFETIYHRHVREHSATQSWAPHRHPSLRQPSLRAPDDESVHVFRSLFFVFACAPCVFSELFNRPAIALRRCPRPPQKRSQKSGRKTDKKRQTKSTHLS